MEIEGDRGGCKRVGRAVLDRVYNKSRGRKPKKEPYGGSGGISRQKSVRRTCLASSLLALAIPSSSSSSSPPPMPSSSRSHKAEAKFNVTTECPSYFSSPLLLSPTSFQKSPILASMPQPPPVTLASQNMPFLMVNLSTQSSMACSPSMPLVPAGATWSSDCS